MKRLQPTFFYIAASLSVLQVSAASFDCAKAKSDSEKLICSDPELSRQDDELANLYRAAKSAATDRDAFKRQTIEEWKAREASCHDRQCLTDWYALRRKQLIEVAGAQAASTTTPPYAGMTSSNATATGDETKSIKALLNQMTSPFALNRAMQQCGDVSLSTGSDTLGNACAAQIATGIRDLQALSEEPRGHLVYWAECNQAVAFSANLNYTAWAQCVRFTIKNCPRPAVGGDELGGAAMQGYARCVRAIDSGGWMLNPDAQ